MVPDSGAPIGADQTDQLRPLNRPRLVTVLTHPLTGQPAVLIEGSRRHSVERVEDLWSVEDEWWRRRISRRYYRLALVDGGARTVYHDLAEDDWYAQAY